MIFKRDDEADDVAEADTAPAPERREETQMTTDSEVTIIGAAAKLEGTVVSAGSLRIDGQVKGQIQADGDVTLSPQSQVEADIRAQNVCVAGRLKGHVVV
jgi:cytoskeletal protein CcmA (bactofilin family)